MKAILIAAIATLGCNAAYAEPVTYVIDARHTFPRFSYTHLGFSLQSSRFDKTSGVVVYDAVAGSGSVGEHPMLHKDAIGANAATTVRRSDFNMGKFAPAVDDELTLTIGREAQRQ